MAFTHNSTLAPKEPSWGTVDKTALPRNAFADMGQPGKKSSWSYPHHWVSGGSSKDKDGIYTTGTMYLHAGGLNAAWAAAQGAHTGNKASSAVISHLNAHRKALGLDKPRAVNWFPEELNAAKVTTLDLVQDRVWAMHPGKLEEIEAFISARLEGREMPDLESLKGKSGNKSDESYQNINGVAVIPVFGVMAKRMNVMTQFSGGTSTELLQRDIGKAMNDPSVESVVLNVDSPGGTVDGIPELTDFVRSQRGVKPIIAHADGMMASAAYWLGSAADHIMASKSAMVGSIGVAATHYDMSQRDANNGVKRTTITSGKYKRIASEEKPLSEEGLAYMQSIVDAYHAMFVDGVAANRGMAPMMVQEKMADGKDYVGKQALDAGFVDSMGTLNDAVALARQKAREVMTFEMLQQNHPDLCQQVFDLGAESVNAEKIKNDALNAERERVTQILSQENADMGARIQAVKEGLSLDASYKLFFEMEASSRQQKLAELQASTVQGVGNAGKPKTQGDSGGSFRAEVERYKTEHGCSYTEASKAVAAKRPELHDAFIESLQPKNKE